LKKEKGGSQNQLEIPWKGLYCDQTDLPDPCAVDGDSHHENLFVPPNGKLIARRANVPPTSVMAFEPILTHVFIFFQKCFSIAQITHLEQQPHSYGYAGKSAMTKDKFRPRSKEDKRDPFPLFQGNSH
jgi:hypothetical protein